MNISIVGRHLDLTDGIKDHIYEKVQKLEKIINPIPEIHVTLSVQKKYIHVAEIALTVKKESVKGLAESEDMYISIDKAVDKVAHHLQKVRDKSKSHKATSLKEEIMILKEESERDAEDLIDKIVFQEIEVKSMDVQEAVMQYVALEQEFLLFERVDTKKINLLRKNSHGEFEVIEPVNV